MEPQRGNGLACSTCLKSFRTKQCLNRHMLRHDANAKVKCKICGKISKHKIALYFHTKMLHTDRNRPSCHTCHRVFSTSGNLRRHIRTAHSQLKRPRFPCEFPGCGKTYSNKEGVSHHVRIEHTENPTRFPCTLCGKEWKTRPDLESHISTHTTEKTYVCSTCGRSFGQRRAMKRHEFTHLEKSARRIFKCEICPQTSLSGGDLQRHVQVVHEDRRNHQCTFCAKRFSISANLMRHVDAMHPSTTEKIHSCEKCGFMSHSKVNLAQHMRRHNSVNRRECYFCQKQFASFSELVRHCRLHTLEL